MKYIFMIIAMHFAIIINAQETVIGGIITDNNGKVIDNALIKLENSDQYTESDQYGKFSISADLGDYIEISHVAYNTKRVRLKNNILIHLEDKAIDLDAIIVKANPLGDITGSSIIYDDIKATTQPRNVSDLFKDIPRFWYSKKGSICI